MTKDHLVVKAKKAKGEDGHKTFSVRLKEDTVNRINGIAAQTGHSRNELIGMFLEYALERCVVDVHDEQNELKGNG